MGIRESSCRRRQRAKRAKIPAAPGAGAYAAAGGSGPRASGPARRAAMRLSTGRVVAGAVAIIGAVFVLLLVVSGYPDPHGAAADATAPRGTAQSPRAGLPAGPAAAAAAHAPRA